MTSVDSFSPELLEQAALYRELRVASHENGSGVNISESEFSRLVEKDLVDSDLSFKDLDTNGDKFINEYDIGEGAENHALRHSIRTGEGLSVSDMMAEMDGSDDADGAGHASNNTDTDATSSTGTPPGSAMSVKWGGQQVDIWDITKGNAGDKGISDGADVFLVTVNDTDLGKVASIAKEHGYEVVATNGKSDAGALMLRPTGNADPEGLEKILNYGKTTITAVNEPEGRRLVPNGGGFETKLGSGMGFGSTDNPSTKGEFFKTTGGNSTIANNREDDGRLWHSGSDMNGFRGGWIGLKWG